MREGYQVCGKTFGPTITIWPTKESANRYMETLKPLRPDDLWWIIKVQIMEVSES